MNRSTCVFVILFVVIVIPGFATTGYKDDAMSLFFAGQNAYNQGNYEEAELYLAKALEIDPVIEAKTPNVKFMLGVSAFKNQHYSVAKVNLSLYADNPIAQDLLIKIEEIERNMGSGFYYYTHENIETQIGEAASSSTGTNDMEPVKQLPLLLIVGIVFASVIGITLFLELKFAFFSRIAVRLVLVKNPVQVTVNSSETGPETFNLSSPEVDETELLLLSDTPFEEKIDIRKMATAEIEEISRFFSQESADAETTIPSASIISENVLLSSEGITDKEISQMVKNEILESTKTEPLITNGEEAVSADQVESWDDFNLQEVLTLGKRIIKESEAENELPKEESGKWKSIGEFTQESEKDLNFFEEKDEVEEEDLIRYFDLLFSREKELIRSE